MPEYDDLIARARKLYADCAIEIENDAPVKPSKAGALVQAWVWVPFEELEEEDEQDI
jgi:hypothetical protein